MYPYTEVVYRDGRFEVTFYTVEGLWTRRDSYTSSDTILMVEDIAEWCQPLSVAA